MLFIFQKKLINVSESIWFFFNFFQVDIFFRFFEKWTKRYVFWTYFCNKIMFHAQKTPADWTNSFTWFFFF